MNAAATVTAILASAVIVLTGVITLARAIWHVAQDLRDNKNATLKNTSALENLASQMDGRLSSIEQRIGRLENPPGT